MEYQCTAERFLKDVANHKMTILRDEGNTRHLQFRGDGSPYWFDVVTWDGILTINGDMGTYVFSRITDMFEFFRTKPNDWNFNKNGLSINPSYWGEKLLAISKDSRDTGSITKFSDKLFEQRVKEYFDRHFEDEVSEDKEVVDTSEEYPPTAEELEGIASRKEKRDDLWYDITREVLDADNEHEACRLASEFTYEGTDFFVDFWDHNLKEYSFHYIWCLYSISWSIQQYDSHKQAELESLKMATPF